MNYASGLEAAEMLANFPCRRKPGVMGLLASRRDTPQERGLAFWLRIPGKRDAGFQRIATTLWLLLVCADIEAVGGVKKKRVNAQARWSVGCSLRGSRRPGCCVGFLA